MTASPAPVAYRDLREFVGALEAEDELVRVKSPVGAHDDIPAIVWELNERHGPAVLFEDLDGYEIPLLANVHSTFARVAMAMGFPADASIKEMRHHYASLLRDPSAWRPPVEVQGSASCKEVIRIGDEATIDILPAVHWMPQDSAPFITLNAVITDDPDFGRNMGTYRMQVVGPRKTGLLALQMQDIGVHVSKARATGKTSMPVAVALGLEPALYLASATKMPGIAADEVAFAGALRGAPVEMVRAETSDLLVPAHAEVVIEGQLFFDELMAEGPFGEVMGYYGGEWVTPTLHITAVTHRTDPIFQTCAVPHRFGENEIIRHIPQTANFYNSLRSTVPGFRDCHVPMAGRSAKAVVQISKRFPGWGRTAIYSTFGVGWGAAVLTQVTVVDADVDIYDPEAVDFAEATRVNPEHDVLVLPGVGMMPIHPAGTGDIKASGTGLTEWTWAGKLGIDATLKLPEEGGRQVGVARPPEDVLARVRADWDKYFVSGSDQK